MIGHKNRCFGACLLAAGLCATPASAQPYSFSGQGRQATGFFSLDEGLTIFSFAHTGKSNFIVELLDDDGNRGALVANEIGYCNGSNAIHVNHRGSYLLKVLADGQWTVSRSKMYHNPFVRQPHESAQNAVPTASSSAPSTTIAPGRPYDNSPSLDGSRISTSAAETKWREVAKFIGSGTKSTEPFTIPDREWRVSWDNEGNGNFSIYIYDDDNRLKQLVGNVFGDSKDSSIVWGGGEYYLTIVGGEYHVTVETNH